MKSLTFMGNRTVAGLNTIPMLKFVKAGIQHKNLIIKLTEREILGRYRGSLFGIFWSFLQPLMMLAVYTLVFSTVFKTRWPGVVDERPIGFAINLFSGLIVFNLISECLTKAPGLVLANPSYVKKVVFPLEVLGYVTVGCALFHGLISIFVLMVFQLFANGKIAATIWLLPITWIPLLLLALSSTWILSAMGVYIRDIGQAIGAFVSMLMFISPIFFPLTALPARWQSLLAFNPLAPMIEQTRAVAVSGQYPKTIYIFAGISLGLILCEFSYKAFMKAKGGFADVM
jgi:lipopolysaccharide transport system permease protein